MGTFAARVASNLGLGADLRLLTLALDDRAAFDFQAGQFVVVPLPTPEGEKPRKGYYTLASAPQARAVQLIVEHRPGSGPVSAAMAALAEGSVLQLEGPQGKPGLAPDASARAFFCQPSGLATARSLILASLYAGAAEPHHLFLGGEGVLANDWSRLMRSHPNFHLHQGPDLAALAARALQPAPGLKLVLSGFNRDVEPLAAALQGAGFDPATMKLEKYG